MSQGINSSYKAGLIVVLAYKITVYVVFLAFYILRISKLDKLASNNYLEKDKSLKFRIGMVSMLILLDTIHIILAYSDPGYWMYQFSPYSLIDLLGILDFTLQLYILTRQHKKKTRRSRSILTLWILMGFSTIATVILVEIYAPNTGTILLIFKAILEFVLIIITLSIDRKPETNLQVLQESIRQSNLLPLLSDNRSRMQKQKIYVEFNKEFQVVLNKESIEFSFKIAVYLGEQSHVITKSEVEFLELIKELTELFPNSEVVNLKNSYRNTKASNVMKYGEEKQKIYENYLIDLTKSSQFYGEPLMNFLNIHPNKRAALLVSKSALVKKDTLNSDDEQKLKRPFFQVMIKQEKQGKIYVSNPQILEIIINKSINDIKLFHHKLLADKRLKIELLSEDPDSNELVHFIFRVVNSKYLWRNFAEWMCLGSAIEDKVFNMFDFWNIGFKNIEMGIIGHEISFDSQGSIVHYYLLSMSKKSSINEGTTLKKRFNQFVKLDRNIHKFIETESIKNANLPSLPPKFSPFGSKTSPKARQVYFDIYIKELIKIEGINHCIKLLQFLEVDSEVISEGFYKLDESLNHSEGFDEIKFNELELDNLK